MIDIMCSNCGRKNKRIKCEICGNICHPFEDENCPICGNFIFETGTNFGKDYKKTKRIKTKEKHKDKCDYCSEEFKI